MITVQSTVTNNSSIKQTVIDLAPILHNSRITLFPYSNIQGNVTIIFLITVCLIELLLVTVDWTVIIDENWSSCSIFIVLNSRHDGVNINISHH
jgi:hypothetical protein